MPKYAARTDANHAEIRDGLRTAGMRVWDCSRFGDGFPDLLVSDSGNLWLLEVKSKGGKLTNREQTFAIAFGQHTKIVYI